MEVMQDVNQAKLVREMLIQSSTRLPSNNWVSFSEDRISYCIDTDKILRTKLLRKWFPTDLPSTDGRVTRDRGQGHTCTQTSWRFVESAVISVKLALSSTLLSLAPFSLLSGSQHLSNKSGSCPKTVSSEKTDFSFSVFQCWLKQGAHWSDLDVLQR